MLDERANAQQYWSMTISKVQMFSIPVSDQDEALAFYVDTLGFSLVADTKMAPDIRWVAVAPQGAETSITLVTWMPSMKPGSLHGVVFETDDLDGDVVRLTENGLSLPQGIEQAPWGRFVQFEDPDGNGLILQATTAEQYQR